MDDEPGWTDVGLDDVFELRTGIFEAGRRMLDDGFGEDFVELGSSDFLMASGVDFGGELEEPSEVVAGNTASDEDRSVGYEVEVVFEIVQDFVGVVDKVGFGENDDDSLAGFDNLAGERLVELGMGLGGVD